MLGLKPKDQEPIAIRLPAIDDANFLSGPVLGPQASTFFLLDVHGYERPYLIVSRVLLGAEPLRNDNLIRG